MKAFEVGLRCQDVHSVLRNVDPNAPLLAPLDDTRLIGMAATLAALIRGRDVLDDVPALTQVAAHQLDVQMLSFKEVISILEEAGYVQGVQRVGGKIVSFTESVPYYDDLYGSLGNVWLNRSPTELEQQLLLIVDGLSRAPVPVEELESKFLLDGSELPQLLELGEASGLIQTLPTINGKIAYSPFFGFENPHFLASFAQEFGSAQLAEEFEAVRSRQGLEIQPGSYPVLTEAVAAGLILAPTVKIPDGSSRAFATLPYAADASLLRTRKPVLDKALAVIACLRCAEKYGEFNTLSAAALINVIDKLLDPNRGFLNPNSAHRRQYELMRNAGIIRFGKDTLPGGSWVTPTFVDTLDNREALSLAKDLLQHGELVASRVDDHAARSVLDTGKGFQAPLQTTFRLRQSIAPTPEHFEDLFERAMGWGEL